LLLESFSLKAQGEAKLAEQISVEKKLLSIARKTTQ
jgi:hypothetical protein